MKHVTGQRAFRSCCVSAVLENFVNHNTCVDIVIYCVTGGTSQRVATQLISDGYLRVRDLQGGITAWQAQGFPVGQRDGGH
jgi:rhodanese-related sulfurtransferase